MATAGTVNVQIGATFASTFKSTFGNAESQIQKLGGTVRSLDGQLQRVNGLQRMRQSAIDAEGAFRKSDAELRSMSQHLAGLSSISDKQAREFKALEKQTNALRVAMERAKTSADGMEGEMRQAGQSTADLVGQQRTLERQLGATTARMQALAKIGGAGVGQALGEVGAQFRSLATQAAIAGAGLGFFFKKNFLDTAAQFEKFQTILETTEGSSDKAKKAMNWVSDFAAKTPFELAEVTEAFVKLRAYGLDPTNGLLQTLGDTGAAMGKPVMQAVEAIADAVTGENERLKEFGIKGSKKGGQVTYEFTDKAGKQQTKTIDANNRALIESTLTAIFNEKYAGAMDKLSKTWGGMTSNVSDQWSRFTNMVMASGPFDLLKQRLGDVLAQIDAMAADGTLKKYAEDTGKALTEFASGAWEVGKAIVSTTQAIAEAVGGWKNFAIGLAAIKLAPMIFSLGKLAWTLGTVATGLVMFATSTATAGAAWAAFGLGFVKWAGMALTAFRALAVFMLTNPIGLALTALGVAAYVLYENWDTVKAGLVTIWTVIKDTAIAAFESIKTAVGGVIDWLAEKTAWIFQTVDKVKAAANSIGGTVGGWFGSTPSTITSTSPATSSAAPAMAAAVPVAAGGGNVTQTNQPTYNITVTGSATDPAATAKAVKEAMDKREREQAATRRSMMIDKMGY